MATFKQGDRVTHPRVVGEVTVTAVWETTLNADDGKFWVCDLQTNFTLIRRPIALGDKVRAQGVEGEPGYQPAGMVVCSVGGDSLLVRHGLLDGEFYYLRSDEVYERRVED